eukprot:TRINITY_DN28302_c0_g1_i1.p1 TRINITY_DN28302_c0_g1~~TRINITY_DN28302_c0_g1_i1.p1  ORF type:complete len:116 (-),score=19.99 TRINITY_DN28302_c0_g1_i1:823-1170(-)
MLQDIGFLRLLILLVFAVDGQGVAAGESGAAREGSEAADVGDRRIRPPPDGIRRDRGLRRREVGLQGVALLRGPVGSASGSDRDAEIAAAEDDQGGDGDSRREGEERASRRRRRR